jgi:glycosyltransferase involved in cell wall biosynthesis
MESALREKYEFVPLAVPRARELMHPAGMARFVRTIRDSKPDMVHYAGLQLEGFFVACAIALAGVKRSVVAVHGSSWEAAFFPRYKKRIVGVLEAATLRLASACYGVSDYVVGWDAIRRNARHCYGRIYNLPHAREGEGAGSLRQELGIPSDAIVLVSTGRIVRDKGFDRLIDTLEVLHSSSDFRVLVVGEGDYLKTLEARVRTSALSERVLCLGYRADVPRILAASDVFVLLSMHETLCMSIIEAGLQALPVVATNVGGIPEIIRDGYNGFLVEPGDKAGAAWALERLIADPDLRATMGAHSRASIEERFSEREIVGQIDELYRGVLSGEWD